MLSPVQVKTAQFLGRLLAEHGHRAALLHGKRPQAEREVWCFAVLCDTVIRHVIQVTSHREATATGRRCCTGSGRRRSARCAVCCTFAVCQTAV
jgi:hypothetical protein